MIRSEEQNSQAKVHNVEQELQKLSRVVQQTADIVFITDRNGLIEYVNPAFEKTTGYRREEVIGKTPRIFKSGEHPESFYNSLWKTILDGLPFRSVLINKKKDGTTFFEEKTITPLRAEDGTITHFVSTGKDVTERIKAVELLRQTEEKAQLVLSNMHEIVYSIRSEDGNFLTGTVDFVNDRAEDLLGFGAKEFMINPRLWLESLHPEDLIAVKESTERLLTDKKAITRVYRITHKHTGEYRWMEDHVVPQISVVDNKVIGILGVARDITERKQVQEALKDSEERYRLLHVHSVEAIYMYDGETKRVIDANPAFLNLLGYSVEEVKTLTLYDFVAHDKESIDRYSQEVLKSGGLFLQPRKWRRKDGTLIDVEITLSKIQQLGKTILYVIARDITERKHVQEQIAMLAHALKSIGECVCITDKDNTVLFVNEAFLKTYGYDEDELLGKHISIVQSPNILPEVVHEILPATLRGGWRGELLNRRKDGNEFPIFLSTSVVRNDKGQPVALIGVAADITERKRVQEILYESEDRYRDLVEHSQDLVCTHDLEGRIVSANPWAAKVLGYEIDTILQMNIRDFLAPEARGGVDTYLAKIQKRGAANGRLPVQTAAGERRIWEYNNTLRTEGVATPIVRGMARDITERKRAQDTLATRTRQQAEIALLGQYALAESDLLVVLNKATEVVAQTLEVEYCKVLELLADGNALLLRAGVGWKQNMVGNATVSVGLDSQAGYTLKTNGPVIVDDFRSETRFRGPALLTDHGVISGVSVIIRGGEHPFGVLGAHTTRRRQFTQDDVNFIQAVSNILAEAVRRKGAEEKYRNLVDDAPVGIYQTDRKGNFLTANQKLAEILGYDSVEELMGKNIGRDIYWDAEERETLIAHFGPIGRATDLEVRWKKRDGSPIWIRMSANAIKDKNVDLIYFEGFIQDITDRKNAEERTQRYARRLQVLSQKLLEIQENERRHIAHELHDEIGQALTSLKILLEMNTKANVDTAKQNLNDALGITGDLILRIRGLSLDLRPHMLDDLGLVPAVRWHLLHRTEKMGIEAHFKAEPEEIHVSGEIKTTCFRVAQEALTNVLKHSKAKSVEVQLTKRGSSLELAIRDDGRGFNVESAFQHSASGESFGLLGMQERARFAGGALVIRSEQGRGSEIKATFPNAFVPSPTDSERSAER